MGHGGREASRPAALGSTQGKIMDFLGQIQGLNALGCADLEALLYQCRFELLPPPKTGAGVSPKRRTLPVFSSIPDQREMHDMLLGGLVPGGLQGVAHVLYPDHVPWPTGDERSAQGRWDRQGSPDMEPTDSSKPSTPKPSSRGGAGASEHEGQRARQTEISPPRRPAASSGAAGSPRSADGAAVEAARKKEDSVPNSDALVEESRAEVILCGQKVTTTVRGKLVLESAVKESGGGDLFAPPAVQERDDERYTAAKEKRVKLERQVQMEHWQERRLAERIQSLEGMRSAEEYMQEALKKREAKRLARRDELRKEIEEGVQRQMEAEKAAAEEEAKRKEETGSTDRRWKKYHESQKEALADWYAKQAEDSAFGEDRARQRREEKAAREAAAREERERNRVRTLKQAETESKIARLLEATEERPPLPPKPHDRPGPVLEMLDESYGKSQKQAPKPRRESWTTQVKAVSNMYGLSGSERADVEARLLGSVQGPGRMAAYER